MQKYITKSVNEDSVERTRSEGITRKLEFNNCNNTEYARKTMSYLQRIWPTPTTTWQHYTALKFLSQSQRYNPLYKTI